MTRYANQQRSGWWATDNDDQYRKRRGALGPQMFTLAALIGMGGLAVIVALGFVIWWVVTHGVGDTVLIVIALVFIVGLFLIGTVVVMMVFAAFSVGKKWDVKVEPQGEQTVVTTRDGVDLHVEVQGDQGARRTVVFVHGIAMSSKMWHHQRNSLPIDTRAILYDARGHGRSQGQKLDVKVPGVRQLADDLGRVIDEKAPGGDLILAVHSMGGMTMFALAAIRPDIFDRVRGILLLNAGPGPGKDVIWLGVPKLLSPLRKLLLKIAAPGLALVGILPGFLLRILGMAPYLIAARWLAVAEDSSKESWRLTARMLYETTPKRYAHHIAACIEHDERPSLDRISHIPMIVVAGEQDNLFKRSSFDSWVKELPQAVFFSIPGDGHMTMLERPQWVTQQLATLINAVEVEPEVEEVTPGPARKGKLPRQNVPYMWSDYKEEVEAAQQSAGPQAAQAVKVPAAPREEKLPRQNVPYMWKDYQEEVEVAEGKHAEKTASGGGGIDLLGQIPGTLKKILGGDNKDDATD
ncbi:MAG: alpha/beta fold hydrolase [Nocardiaceae bacterium]|nr:alpha/beta fold hydrolase [Nocardiaceae bacterium]